MYSIKKNLSHLSKRRLKALLAAFLMFALITIISFTLYFKNNVSVQDAKAATIYPPQGTIDVITSSFQVAGWAFDKDDQNKSLDVHFYIDGPAGQGVFIGSANANNLRADVNSAYGIIGNHGYAFSIPAEYQSGYRKIYAYTFDAVNGSPIEIRNGSVYPITFGTKPNGDSSISSTINGSPITIKTENRLAGGISSIVWNNKEFVFASDHGQGVQTAIALNEYGECWNPTEQGSVEDGGNLTSSSVLQDLKTTNNTLSTQTQMAFWVTNNKATCSDGSTKPLNKQVLSNYIMKKNVSFGYLNDEHIIKYDVSLKNPANEYHTGSTLEIITGYSPAGDFKKFYTYNLSGKVLTERNYASRPVQPIISDGEFSDPYIIASPDGKYAFAGFSPDVDANQNAGFNGAFFPNGFDINKSISKWTVVSRTGYLFPAESNYRAFMLVGTLNDVKSGLDKLYSNFVNNGWKKDQYSIGTLGTFSTNGVVNGWAYNRSNSTQKVQVDFFLDAKPDKSNSIYIGNTMTGIPRPDVNAAVGLPGDMGFEWTVPAQYRTGTRTIYAYVRDLTGYGGSPLQSLTVTFPNNTISPSLGVTSTISPTPTIIPTATTNPTQLSCGNVTVLKNISRNAASFNVNVANVLNASTVKFAVWSDYIPAGKTNSQDDLKWYNATNKGNGIWSYDIPTINHPTTDTISNVNIHVYLDGLGKTNFFCNSSSTNITLKPICTNVSIPSTISQTSSSMNVSATGIVNASIVKFAVWSEAGGQNDLKWYNGTNAGNGTWNLSIPLANHPTDSTSKNIIVHAYMDGNNYTNIFCNGGSVSVQ